ncbi:MAG: ubiquitin carboxyl-hydrolase [Cyclobacterium sp.]|uniref:ubiquitin carboxyl-hydrolase n=1 Tax=unclassified Cyclobacterium TaxID=2615055 RepID=UPI0013D3C01D|nr:ubiquitin carboxyl-hydrolase [Cyclobacterium sp. SYSU L10401]
MKYVRCFMLFFLVSSLAIGQQVSNVELVDAFSGKTFSTARHPSSTTMVFVFTSLTCPYAKLYEDRILALHQKYSGQNVIFMLVNPHAGQTDESKEQMATLTWARDSGIPFLMDNDQAFTQQTSVRKIPEVVLISSGPTGYSIAYQGAIDNNAQSASSATVHYLDNALRDILSKKRPSPAITRAVGCNIRLKN